MSEISVALFSISFLLMFYVSVGHTVVKRKAPDGKLYVFSQAKGCVSVQSEAPCTVAWQLNPYVAKRYKQSNEVVETTLKLYEDLGFSDQCREAMNKTFCSQVVPRCSVEDGSLDYGDAANLCRQDVYNFCPQALVDGLKQNKFCDQLVRTGKRSSQCVAPSTPVKGVCPQPKYKMPEEFLSLYRENSVRLSQTYEQLENLRYDNGERIFSSECLAKLKEITCSPLYCSDDESVLLVKHDQGDCNAVIKECFDDLLSKLSSTSSIPRSFTRALRKLLQSACDAYPNASTAQLQAEPQTIFVPANRPR